MISPTSVLAIYGAVLSTVAVVWNLLRDVQNRSRELRKKLTAEIYSPARRQLTEASQYIQGHKRAYSIDGEMWRIASASGLTRKLKPELKERLAALYEHTLPNYDKAWQVLNEEIAKIGGEWDQRYADIPDHQTATIRQHNIVKINWWDFLTADGPVTPIDGLRDNDVLRLWDRFMTPARFKPQSLDRTPEQFLIDRWHEAARIEALRQYKKLRKSALADIPKAIASLDRSSLY